jgi:hypothetical protein
VGSVQGNTTARIQTCPALCPGTWPRQPHWHRSPVGHRLRKIGVGRGIPDSRQAGHSEIVCDVHKEAAGWCAEIFHAGRLVEQVLPGGQRGLGTCLNIPPLPPFSREGTIKDFRRSTDKVLSLVVPIPALQLLPSLRRG